MFVFRHNYYKRLRRTWRHRQRQEGDESQGGEGGAEGRHSRSENTSSSSELFPFGGDGESAISCSRFGIGEGERQ